MQALKARVEPQVRALVVLPTRDLANQVYKVFEAYTSGSSLRVGMAFGLKSLASEQTQLVHVTKAGVTESRVDIVVATPGRLVDHVKQTKGFSLQFLRFLVRYNSTNNIYFSFEVVCDYCSVMSLVVRLLTKRIASCRKCNRIG